MAERMDSGYFRVSGGSGGSPSSMPRFGAVGGTPPQQGLNEAPLGTGASTRGPQPPSWEVLMATCHGLVGLKRALDH
eukprot:scaffold148799_cov13-Prasinocladus_malaysianus.AAC.1